MHCHWKYLVRTWKCARLLSGTKLQIGVRLTSSLLWGVYLLPSWWQSIQPQDLSMSRKRIEDQSEGTSVTKSKHLPNGFSLLVEASFCVVKSCWADQKILLLASLAWKPDIRQLSLMAAHTVCSIHTWQPAFKVIIQWIPRQGFRRQSLMLQ